MDKRIDFIKNKTYLLAEIIVSNLLNFFTNLKSNNNNYDYLIIYAPYNGNPWILNKIIEDLKNNSHRKEKYKIFKSLFNLSLFRFKYGGQIFTNHQSNIRKLNWGGIPLNCISIYYTHSRINQKGIRNIRKIKKIFCQNNYELQLLKSSGIEENKLIDFPVGLHSNFINNNKNFFKHSEKEIDVLFCLRNYKANYHYSIRKRYDFIINLSNLLSESNLKVCILGKGWENEKAKLNKSVIIADEKYSEYSKFYKKSKIYCNPSLSEGGPISLLEAFSSGCIIFTTPVGLSFNYCLDDDLSFMIPFSADEKFWQYNIIKIINKDYDKFYLEKIFNSRKINLEKSSFKYLSNILENNLLIDNAI